MSDQPKQPDAPQGAATGSVIVPQYTERHMTFYCVTPREMRDLSLIGGAALGFFAVGSFLLSTAIGFHEGAVFSGPAAISAEGKALSDYGAPFAFIASLVFYLLGVAALVVRSRGVDEIKTESKQVTATVRISASGEATSKPQED